MTWSHDEAAKKMGMAPHEILAVAEVGDVHVVTTHDGQHTVVTDDGEVQLLTAAQADAAFGYADGADEGDEGGGEPPTEGEGDDGGEPPTEGEGDDGGEPPAGGEDGTPVDELPDGDAKQILAWVGEDADRAAQALEHEAAKEKPRSTLIAALQKVAPPS